MDNNPKRVNHKKYTRPQLKLFMVERQLSQKELASILEVAESTVSHWLKTDALPQLLTKELFCEKFNLPSEEFWKLFSMEQ